MQNPKKTFEHLDYRSQVHKRSSLKQYTSEPKPNCSEKEEHVIITIPFKDKKSADITPGGYHKETTTSLSSKI